MTPDQAGAASRKAVARLGTAYLECPKTLRRARELGLTGWAAYVAGRAGALGDVRPDTVAAALGLIAPEAVRDGWAAARAVLPPTQIAGHMLAECRRWGAEKLDGAPRIERLAALLETVAAAADAAGLPLFAAWRAMPMPSRTVDTRPRYETTPYETSAPLARFDTPLPRARFLTAPPAPVTPEGAGARAAVAVHLLAEHRAGALLMAIRTSGLTPLQALIAGPEGEAAAVAFGWQPPYPAPAPLLRRRAWADAVADRLSGQVMRALSDKERAEMVSLLREALAHFERR